MVDVRIRRTAKRDLAKIGNYTRERWSEAQAEVYLQSLLHIIEEIGQHPLSGQDAVSVRAAYRRRLVGAHLIFYAVMPDGSVEIARILHEKSDVLRHLDNK